MMTSALLFPSTPATADGCFSKNNPWKTADPWASPASTTPPRRNTITTADSPLLLSSSVWTPIKKELDNIENSWAKDHTTSAMAPPKVPTLESMLRPPAVVSFAQDWPDDVSVLNDNPDEDDAAILPQPTYDVLANIFDELYKDESEIDEDEGDDIDNNNGYPADRACAA